MTSMGGLFFFYYYLLPAFVYSAQQFLIFGQHTLYLPKQTTSMSMCGVQGVFVESLWAKIGTHSQRVTVK